MGLRVVKLYPEQVARHWDFLSPLIESTLPPVANNSEDRMVSVLESILAGNLDVLQFFTIDDSGNIESKGFAVVAVINNIDGTGKQLLIYSAYSFGTVSRAEIVEGINLLINYARGQGCDSLTAYTNLPGLVAYFKRLGGSSTYTFLKLEV